MRGRFIAILSALIGFVMAISVGRVYASHAEGADLTYKCLGGNQYQVTLAFYRDCEGIDAPTSVTINVSSASCGQNFNITLNPIPGTGQEISPICSQDTTTCRGGTYPGVQQYIYTGTVTMPMQCNDWVFSYYICCRNGAISTIANPASQGMNVEAHMDNLDFPCNSSPVFSNPPITFTCIGQEFCFNHGATDADGDSLSYQLVNPESAPGTPVTYLSPYSATQPLASNPPVTFNQYTGDICMTPTQQQVTIMAVLVKEWENGQLVGSVVRDIQLRTMDCTNSNPYVTGINGSGNFSMNVCANQPVNFTIPSSDPDNGQIVTMTWNSGISGATLTSNGTVHPTGTFTWTPTYADVSNAPHQFTVTVTDNNCPYYASQTYAFDITVLGSQANAGPDQTVCVTNPQVTLAGSITPSGTGTWSGGGGTFSPSNTSLNAVYTPSSTELANGQATLILTPQDTGCVVPDTVVIHYVNFAGTINTTSTNVVCHGDNSGQASVYINGGNAPYSYNWNTSPPQTNATATSLSAGTYSVIITDEYGCQDTKTFNITQPTALSLTMSSNPTNCGASNGTADVSVSGGIPGYTYSWSPKGGSDSHATGLPPDVYTVTVTDANGCTDSATVTVGTGPLPGHINMNETNVNCYNGSDGTATATVNGGQSPYSYLWSNGDTNATATGLSAGMYVVQVTTSGGCTSSDSIMITQPATPVAVTVSVTDASCYGSSTGSVSANASGGTSPYTYAWNTSPVQTGTSANNLPAGTYAVTVTDHNGCTLSESATINQPTQIQIAVTDQHNVSCHGGSDASITVNASGGTAPYTYSWNTSPVQTTNNAVGLSVGTYVVTVTDAHGCTATKNITITEPPVLQVAVTNSQEPACFGESNGSATAVAGGGTAPYYYAWSTSPVQTTAVANNLASGTYTVTVTDANGCSVSDTQFVAQPPALAATITGLTPDNCYQDNNGNMTVTASGGTGAYSYSWSTTPVQMGTTASNLYAGAYTVTVKDANGCTAQADSTVTEPAQLQITTNELTAVSCYGGNNGSANAFVTGGVSPYSYDWSTIPNQYTDTATNLPAGSYNLLVFDAHGCPVSSNVTITQPELLQGNIEYIKNVTCYGLSDGYATVTTVGGTGPYTYQWNSTPAQTGYMATGLPAGNYTVTITDTHGCTTSLNIPVTQPDTLLSTIGDVSNVKCYGGDDGTADVAVTGGTEPYQYVWSTNPMQTGEEADSLSAGTYHVMIVDSNGCQTAQLVQITQPSELMSQITSINNAVCFGDSNGTATVAASGGTGPYQYNWSTDPEQHTGTATGLANGNYNVVIIDANGCSTTNSATIQQPQPVVTNVNGIDTICSGQPVTLSATASGGNGSYSYNWSPSAGTGGVQVYHPVVTTTYTVTAIDSNGCYGTPATHTVTTTILTAGDMTMTPSEIICDGQQAFVGVHITGNTGPVTMQWDNGLGTSPGPFTVAPHQTTTYNVVASDACGHTAADSTTITVNPKPIINIPPQSGASCYQVTLTYQDTNTANVGSSYYWDFGDGNSSTETSPEHSYTNSGVYTVTVIVTSPQGCQNDTTGVSAITVYSSPVAKFSLNPSSTTILTPTISFTNHSIAASNYFWTFGDGTSSTQVNPVHTYQQKGNYTISLRVNNQHGCLDSTLGNVEIKPEFALYIPNAFSPNGDAENNYFTAKGTEVAKFHMMIFDRWGQLIFQTDDMSKGWDGRANGGTNIAQEDVYIYKISVVDFKGNKHNYIGHVSLIK